ncbi:MAG: NACHT domain-containing NTPase [Lysobacterales bacterium]
MVDADLGVDLSRGIGKLWDWFSNHIQEHRFGKALIEPRKFSRSLERLNVFRSVFDPNVDSFIKKIFVPPDARTGDGRTATLMSVDQISRLSCIVGNIGYGKTTLMRYLAVSEAEKGCLPIFLEFRRIVTGQSIVNAVSEFIQRNLGPRVQVHRIPDLLNDARVSFFFDGTDEVTADKRRVFIAQIRTLVAQMKAPRFLIAGRDLSGAFEIGFSRIQLLPYSTAKVESLLERLVGRQQALVIKSGLEARPMLASILETPLLVTLLAARARFGLWVPETPNRFYDDIFDVLYKLHDEIKGDSEFRRLNMSPTEAREVFCAFCFGLCGQPQFTAERADRAALLALPERLRTKVDVFKREVLMNTGLVREENHLYSFANSSICQYYAARYAVSSAHSRRVEETLNRLATSPDRYKAYGEFLDFLCDMDRVGFVSGYAIVFVEGRRDWLHGILQDIPRKRYGHEILELFKGEAGIEVRSNSSHFFTVRDVQMLDTLKKFSSSREFTFDFSKDWGPKEFQDKLKGMLIRYENVLAGLRKIRDSEEARDQMLSAQWEEFDNP